MIGASTYGGDSVVTYAGPAKRRLDLPFEGLSIADQQYLGDLVRIIETRGFTNPTLNRFGTGIVFEEL